MYIFKGDVTCACTFPIVVDFLSSATLVCRKTDSFNVLCLLLSSSCTVSSKLQHFSSCTFSSDLQQSLEPSKLQPKLISSPIQLQQCIYCKIWQWYVEQIVIFVEIVYNNPHMLRIIVTTFH